VPDIDTSLLADARSGYDRWAKVYDHDANPLVALEEPVVRSMLPDVQGEDVLDLGCGTGRHAHWLARSGAAVVALDFSEGMLAEARGKPGADRITFIRHDLMTPLPLEPETFDVVVSGLVLEHVPDLCAFFDQSKRVLRAGGRAVFSAMHPAMMLRGAHARFTDPESGQVVAPGSLPHQVSDFVNAAIGAGFRVDRLVERMADESLASSHPRAEKYVGWPMLLVMQLL